MKPDSEDRVRFEAADDVVTGLKDVKTYIAAYVASAVVFLGIDALWIGWIARDFYMSALGDAMRERPNFVVALLFYAIYVAGIVVFAIMPSLADSWSKAALLGGFFGLCAYATYDLTNFATLRNFPARLALVDLSWGVCLTALVAVMGRFAARWVSG